MQGRTTLGDRASAVHRRRRGPDHRARPGTNRRDGQSSGTARTRRPVCRAPWNAVQRLAPSANLMSVQSWFNRIWYDRTAPPWWLLPASLVYGAVSGSRRLALLEAPAALDAAVLSRRRGRQSERRGNRQDSAGLLAGGADWAERGFKPGVVTRGYGGSSRDVRSWSRRRTTRGWSAMNPSCSRGAPECRLRSVAIVPPRRSCSSVPDAM